MENQGCPYKDEDIAETSSEVGGCQRELFQDQLPADSVETQDQHSQAEPGDVSGGEKWIPPAELEAGGSQTLHEDGDDRQHYDITALFEKFI